MGWAGMKSRWVIVVFLPPEKIKNLKYGFLGAGGDANTIIFVNCCQPLFFKNLHYKFALRIRATNSH